MKNKHLFAFLFLLHSVVSINCLADSKPFLIIDSGGHMGFVSDVVFTNDGSKVISAGRDKTVRIWDIENPDRSLVLRGAIGPGDKGVIHAIALSHNGQYLAVTGSLSSKMQVRIIDLDLLEIVKVLDSKSNHRTSDRLDFSHDDRHLIVSHYFEGITVWDIKTGKLVKELEKNTGEAREVGVGNRLIYSKYYKETKEKEIKIQTTGRYDKVIYKGKHFGDYSISNDYRYVAMIAGRELTLFDNQGTVTKQITLMKKERSYPELAFYPDNKKLFIVSREGYKVLSVPDLRVLHQGKKRAKELAISRSGGKVAITDRDKIHILDGNSFETLKTLKGKGIEVSEVGYEKNGKSIAWGYRKLQNRLVIRPDLEHQITKLDPNGYQFEIKSKGLVTISREKSQLKIMNNGKQMKTPWGWQAGSTLTPDGRTIIRGYGWAYMQSLNTKGERLKSFKGHFAEIWNLAVSPDSRYLISGSLDQTARLWDINTGKLLLTIFQADDDEWVAWIPEGYYISSVKGDKYIGWHMNQGDDKLAIYYPSSSFSSKYRSEHIVKAYINNGGRIDDAIKTANKLKKGRSKLKFVSKENLKTILPPIVKFINPENRELTVNKQNMTIKAVAISVNSEPITEFFLLHNGKKVAANRGFKVSKKANNGNKPFELHISEVVQLIPGENRLSLVAKNSQSQSEPRIVYINYQKPVDEDIMKPKMYVLSIGVSKYQDSSFNLDLADKDALAISKAFKSYSNNLFRGIEYRTLLNENATRDGILDGLDWLESESTQKDVSVIFIAGHGMKDRRNDYYFLPFDGNVNRLRRTGVKWTDFQASIEVLPSKVLFLVDTCHSGSATGSRKTRGATNMTDAIRELIETESGLIVMTASTGNESALEDLSWGNGAFTKALTEGLAGRADYNSNSFVDIKELDLYVTERVKQLTKGYQHPTTEIPRTLPNFSLSNF